VDNQYVVIRDHADGNETIGEMWQETKIFEGSVTLDEVMKWAMSSEHIKESFSRRRITITKPHS
jgi:hypothetical protein